MRLLQAGGSGRAHAGASPEPLPARPGPRVLPSDGPPGPRVLTSDGPPCPVSRVLAAVVPQTRPYTTRHRGTRSPARFRRKHSARSHSVCGRTKTRSQSDDL